MCDAVFLDASDPTEPECVPTRIVRGIAALEDVDPTDLEFRLADHVDVDALEALFARPDAIGDVRLEWSIAEFDVVVDSPGDVRVVRACDRPEQCETAVV